MNNNPESVELNVDHFLISTYENQLILVFIDELQGQNSLQ